MPHADVRFEICVNGQPVGTIGIEAFGVLTAIVSRVRRSPDKIADAHRQRPGFDEAAFLREVCELSMTGLDSVLGEHRDWGTRPLAAGDVVTIRVLAAGPCDPPRTALANTPV
ncbi:hypothetical protein KAK06_18440 [Ideonella sp. 4Y11]|uniref:Uncharacterized protein n=1 Tax=Ideonella aquatica TaxID=2824119 RepID=A0A941BHI4_9BURK|nr:hypothetical protein [Ideonella aquatica]MBQ0960941.1 hypothetical protein [Ideonella aquatica]